MKRYGVFIKYDNGRLVEWGLQPRWTTKMSELVKRIGRPRLTMPKMREIDRDRREKLMRGYFETIDRQPDYFK